MVAEGLQGEVECCTFQHGLARRRWLRPRKCAAVSLYRATGLT